jgi:hypothetical protein
MKIKLELIVDYDEGDTPYADLAGNLWSILSISHANGLFTDDTDATVNGYVYTTERIKE